MTPLLKSSAAMAEQPITLLSVASVFGTLTYQDSDILHFPSGILGLPMLQHFILAPSPLEKLHSFLIFQPIPPTLQSFLVLPLGVEGLIRKEDFEQSCSLHGFHPDDSHLLAIVTFAKEDEGFSILANLTAPILVEMKQRLGVQHVFEGKGYQLRHPLGRCTMTKTNPT